MLVNKNKTENLYLWQMVSLWKYFIVIIMTILYTLSDSILTQTVQMWISFYMKDLGFSKFNPQLRKFNSLIVRYMHDSKDHI